MAEVKGIRDYNRIRRFLRNIHLYGFFSREDFAQAGIGSVKDYDFGAALIRSIFPETEEDARWQQGRKYLRIRREYARSGENRLADSYRLHPIDEKEELPELLSILHMLGREGPTMKRLQVKMQKRDGEADRSATVRRRVKELDEYGCVVKRKDRYYLREEGLNRLSTGEVEDLLTYVRFSGGITQPRTAAFFLTRTLERELYRRGVTVERESPVLLRHGVNNGIFDEELVYSLIRAIRDGQEVKLTVRKGRDEAECTCLPVSLRVDCRLGRWYLLGLEERPVIRRMSNILRVKPLGKVSEEEGARAKERVEEAFAHTGCSGALPMDHPVLVEAKLYFDRFPGMGRQFQRELRLGEVVEKEDGTYYRAYVNDPLEVLPLLRSYSPWLRVRPGEHDLVARLEDGLARMEAALEEVPNESAE